MKFSVELMAAAISIRPETRASALVEPDSSRMSEAGMSWVAGRASTVSWSVNIPDSFPRGGPLECRGRPALSRRGSL